MTTATAHRLPVVPGLPAGSIDWAIRTEQPTRRFGESGAVAGLSKQQVGIAAPSSEIPGCCRFPF